MILEDEASKEAAEGFEAEGLVQAISVIGRRAKVISM